MVRRWVVEPNAVGGWDVRRDDEANRVFRSSARAEAEREARSRADSSGADVVVVDGRGGVLDTYVPPPRPAASPRRPAAPPRAAAPPDGAPPPRAEAPAPVPAPEPAPEPAARAGRIPVEPAAEQDKAGDDPMKRFADAFAKADGGLADRLAEAGRTELTARADTALGRGFKAWYARADENQRIAAVVLIGAALLGPIGATFLTVVKAVAHPTLTTQIVESLFWLAVLTLPVLTAAVVGTLIVGHANGPVSLFCAALAAVVGASVVGKLGVPETLGKLYCYAIATSDGLVYEHACRVMDTQGFVTNSLGKISPSTSVQILGNAFNLVSDARGGVMAICGVAAGLSAGYLTRRASQT
jgi:hypothetical protein